MLTPLMMRERLLRWSFGAAVLAVASACGPDVSEVDAPVRDEVAVAAVASEPTFVENRGAWDPAVRYALLGGPTTAWIGATDLTLRLERHAARASAGAVVRLNFGDATDVVAEGPQRPPVHVLRGTQAAGAVATGRVRMVDAWPGIDVVFRADPAAGALGTLAYDLHVAGWAEPEAARVSIAGARILAPTGDGGLVLAVPLGDAEVELVQRAPVSWVQDADGRRPVRSRLRRIDAHTFGFEVEGRDRGDELVIDPGFVWSTYLGGGASDSCSAVRAVRGTGIAVAGWAGSSDFPTTVGAYRTTGARDAFVAMLSEDGSHLSWSTYVGGRLADEAVAIDVAADGGVVVGGWTSSPDFPTTAGVVQPWFGWGSLLFEIGDGFVLRLAPDGSRLEWSTYLGRLGDDYVKAVHANADGSVLVGGETTADAFPTTAGVVQPTFGSANVLAPDVFVARLAPGATRLEWSTYFGAFAQELLEDMCVAPDGSILIAGLTASQDFRTTPGVFQSRVQGSWDGFVARISPDGRQLLFSTLLGGEGYDQVRGVAVDARGEIWTVGRTTSDGGAFPFSADAFQTAFGGLEDGYVARLSADGTTLRAATLLGGAGDDSCEDLVVDAEGHVLVVGYTSGDGFPVGASAAQPTYGGGVHDGFVAHLDRSLSVARAISFAGGSRKDMLHALDAFGGEEVVAVGTTFSTDLPVAPGAVQPTSGGDSDAVLLRVDLATAADVRVVLEDLSSSSATAPLLAGTTHVLCAVGLSNPGADAIDLRALDVAVAGASGGAACLTALSAYLDVDTDGAIDPGEPLLAAPTAAAAGVTRLDLEHRLAPGARAVVLVAGTTGPNCPDAAELLGGVPAPLAVVARRVADGRRVLVTGAARVQGPSHVAGARRTFSGDLDGDARPTCRDARRLAMRLGEAASDPAEDPDGDGSVTDRDVDLVLARVVTRPPAFADRNVVAPGSMLTLEGYDLGTGTVAATLDGRPVSVALHAARVLALRVPEDAHPGVRRLRVTLDGSRVVETDLEVQ